MTWMKSTASALLLAGVFISSTVCAEVSHNTAYRCNHPLVHVLASNPKDVADACRGIDKALSFFAGHQLYLTSAVVLEINARLPDKAPSTAAGVYSAENHRIHLLTYAEFRNAKTWFNLPITRELYQSVATHEMAHAISTDHFTVPAPTILAKEYLAYVAMFATMSSPLRKRALLSLQGNNVNNELPTSPILLMFDPMLFGAQAYRHYSHLNNPGDFLRSVLTGKALNDLEMPY